MTLRQLHGFLTTLFHAPKSSLENPSWAHKSGPSSLVSTSYELDQYVMKDTGYSMRPLETRGSLMSTKTSSGCVMRTSASGQGRSFRKGGKSNGGKGKPGKSKGKGSTARRFFRPCRKGGGKGKAAVHLLARRISMKKKLRKRRLRMTRCCPTRKSEREGHKPKEGQGAASRFSSSRGRRCCGR